jgi:hypothetical protein
VNARIWNIIAAALGTAAGVFSGLAILMSEPSSPAAQLALLGAILATAMIQQHYVLLALVVLVLVMNLLGLGFTINRNMRLRQRSNESQHQPKRALEHARQ